MKKKLLLIAGCLSVFTSFSQVYSDTFDANLTVANTDYYTASLSNGNLVVTGNGGATAYQTFSYQMHNNGTLNSVDISNDLVLYIKAKGTGLPDLRIDLQDDDGNATNLNSTSIKLKDEFEILSIDYTGKLLDAYSGKPGCAVETPCDVDASKTAVLAMFVNAATGGYNGTIEIDWISFGSPLEAPPEASEFQIRYNQMGYTIGQKKTISIIATSGQFSNKAYSIYDSANALVTSGTTGSSVLWGDSNEHTANIDITSINTAGTYTFVIDEETIGFTIAEDNYSAVREEAFKYYYYNRASTALTQQYAGDYARAAGHPDDVVYVHKSAASTERPEGTQISAPKGWYDAGDYNKYIVNSGISTYTLLAAFEHYPNYFTDTNFGIPESGGNLPDILDEAKWNLDWMLAMQDPNDGGVYHKLTGLNFSGSVMPNEYTFDRYVVKKSTSAALNFAAVMAVASRIYLNYDTGFSATMLQAAKDAYTWAQNNPNEFYFQPNMSGSAGDPLLDDVKTGEYKDNILTDEFQWAAVELYITTNEQTYADDFNASLIDGGVPGWQNVATLALLSIAYHSDSLPTSITTAANANLIAIANELKGKVNNSAMNVAMASTDFVWGSNGVAANQLFVLLNAYQLTEDSSYLDASYKHLDYLFGRNATGYSFVTGFGDNTPTVPHHRISSYDNVGLPVPGMLVGGPHSGQEDVGTNSWECSASVYPSTLPAASYTDNYCSYSTNEVTINWNAPLVYALHALRAIQTGNDGTLSNADNYSEAFAEKFEVYPNPTSDTIYVKSLDVKKKGIIELFTLKGEKISSTTYDSDNLSIDLSKSANGVYLMRITLGKETFTTKIIKE